ncbi:LysR family transcriptional regulator [Sulfitobacter sp.]|uniref:LysR family transcriptional regulator n=1 Tax=Sulfitobacter sp. TaxID=1903071 RepID=UPI0030021327
MGRFSNTNKILAFVTIAREGSVSRAADVSNLPQPAVSQRIQRLRKEISVTLFDRTAEGFQISHDGTPILAKTERVLEAIDDFQLSARQQSAQLHGKFKFGTIVDPESIRLGRNRNCAAMHDLTSLVSLSVAPL